MIRAGKTSGAAAAALTAEILFTEPPIVNQVVFTAGDTITYAGLSEVVEAVLGREMRRVEWSVARLQDELAQDPDNATRKYRVVFAEGRGVACDMTQTF